MVPIMAPARGYNTGSKRPDSLSVHSFHAVDGVAEQDDAEDGG